MPLRNSEKGGEGQGVRERSGRGAGGDNAGLSRPHLADEYFTPQQGPLLFEAGLRRELHSWQAECLASPGVLCGRSLVFSAPTSAGKSAVAEILILRRVSGTGRPAMVVLPYLSLCEEWSKTLSRTLRVLGRDVCNAYGSSPASISPSTGAIVCTIERANLLANRLLASGQLDTVSCVVIDELHMVGDTERGYQLELLIAKLRYASSLGASPTEAYEPFEEDTSESREDATSGCCCRSGGGGTTLPTPDDVGNPMALQIIGMSATLSNLDMVADWMGAALYSTHFRPIMLRQFVKIGRDILDEQGTTIRRLVPTMGWSTKDPDLVCWLARETAQIEQRGVIIFCASKRACERTAALAAELLDIAEYPPSNVRAHGPGWTVKGSPKSDRATLSARICSSRMPGSTAPSGSRDDTSSPNATRDAGAADLARLVRAGVAFHHAGLSRDVRDTIEEGFRAGSLRVLAATSTLAVGVNLPARRVIIQHAYVGLLRPENLLSSARYHQMAGRAGRTGLDDVGECIVLAGKETVSLRYARSLICDTGMSVTSCLSSGASGMRRAMLEAVAAGIVRTPGDVRAYVGGTFLAATRADKTVTGATIDALVWLGDIERAFITWNKVKDVYEATALGKASAASGLPTEQCLSLYSDLRRARVAFVATHDLHLAYLCVPINELIPADWSLVLLKLKSLQSVEATVVQRIGLDLTHVIVLASANGKVESNQPALVESARIARRLWTAMLLLELVEHGNTDEILAAYKVHASAVHGLRDRCARFSTVVATFCHGLGWPDLEILVSKFHAVVLHGVREELLALTEISFVGASTARRLYSAGYRSIEDIALIPDEDALERVLVHGATNAALARLRATQIIQSAKELVSQTDQKKLPAAASVEFNRENENGRTQTYAPHRKPKAP